MAVKPMVRENLSTQLYNNLRTALMDGQYSPGERLTISSIAEEYSVSITPVREAIFRLVSEKALETRAATSVQVPELSVESLREIQSIRVELEGLAAAQAALKIDAQQLAELEELNARFIASVETSPATASLLNRDFHFAVLRLSRMPYVEGICENMWVLMGPFLRTFHSRMPLREIRGENHRHFDLLRALRARDAEASRQAMQADIRWGEEMLRTIEAERKQETA
ncbi:GntR family transcriptional regulator [Pseudochelatococcus sp. B33]